jgi:Ser/Thr protein kinase RdoA (MazF antagonist)
MPMYYKVHRVRPDASDSALAGKLETFTRVLERGPALAEQFARRAAGIPVDIPAVLHAEVDRLLEVQVAVPGTPMEHLALRAVPGRRRETRAAYRAVGQAIAVLGSLEDAALPSSDPPAVDATAMADGLRDVLEPGEAPRLAGLIAEFERTLDTEADLAYCHGDISSGNLLLHRGRVGLIDPLWSVRWRGADVALHAARLQHELLQVPAWTRLLVAEILAGYGDPQLPFRPVWQMMALRHAVGTAAGGAGRLGALRRRRALTTIRRSLDSRPR